jgi:hypothetical protein
MTARQWRSRHHILAGRLYTWYGPINYHKASRSLILVRRHRKMAHRQKGDMSMWQMRGVDVLPQDGLVSGTFPG